MKNIDIKKLRTPNENETVAIWLNLDDVINYLEDKQDYWKDIYIILKDKKNCKHKAEYYLSKVILFNDLLIKFRSLRE